MQDHLMDFARLLRDHRSRASLTQSALASKVGVSDITISEWERAICRPRQYLLPRLADALTLTDKQKLTLICKSSRRKLTCEMNAFKDRLNTYPAFP